LNKHDCPYLETKCEDITCPCPKYLAYKDANDPQKLNDILEKNNFDTSLPAWELMYSMQKSFESRFHKELGNLSKDDMDYWLDKYLVCIEDEIREVRECLNLYCNKQTILTAELKKEVIDILHFVMDLFICGNASSKDIKQFYTKRYLNKDIMKYGEINNLFLEELMNAKDLIELAYKIQSIDIFEYLNLYSTDKLDWSILKATCRLSDAGAQVRQQISWKHWKKPNDTIDIEKLYDAFALVFHEFINLCLLTMQYEEVKNIYIKKNVENIQRQYYGY